MLALVGTEGGLALLLGRWKTAPLARLRSLEWVVFAPFVLFLVWNGSLNLANCLPELRAGQYRMTIGMADALPFVLLIVIYGVFIPNTWHRCAAASVLMGSAALVRNTWVTLAGDVPAGHAGLFLVNMSAWLGVAIVIVAYGAHRIEVLRIDVVAARRLGQYVLKARLGGGGMGEVYLAEHLLLKQPCAIKLIHPGRAGDPKALSRFEREVQATARLKHFNTVHIYDYGRAEDGTFYYAMEYLPGLSLEELVARHGPLPPARAIHFLRQVCAALREAHGAGLIHRDVKPGNVIACERGGVHDVAKLLDFGLARAAGADAQDERLTQDGVITGTPAYMSPEQAGGQEELDARSDIYSLGTTAYFLLTGQPPFRRAKAVQVILAHIRDPVEGPTALRADVPADLEAVVLRCLEKDPGKRFPDAQSLERALASCRASGVWSQEAAAAWWRSHAGPTQEVPPP
jgi:serine/threonine-protein kinase